MFLGTHGICCSLQIWHVSYGRCVQGRAVVHHRRQVGSQLPGSVGQHFAAQHLHTRHEDTESVGWSRVQWRGERTPPQHRAASNLANFTESDAPLQSPSRACSTRECHKNRQSSREWVPRVTRCSSDLRKGPVACAMAVVSERKLLCVFFSALVWRATQIMHERTVGYGRKCCELAVSDCFVGSRLLNQVVRSHSPKDDFC